MLRKPRPRDGGTRVSPQTGPAQGRRMAGQSHPFLGTGNKLYGLYTPPRRHRGLRGWLSRCRGKLPLPRAWHLRRDVRRIDRLYVSLIAHATGQEREGLKAEWEVE